MPKLPLRLWRSAHIIARSLSKCSVADWLVRQICSAAASTATVQEPMDLAVVLAPKVEAAPNWGNHLNLVDPLPQELAGPEMHGSSAGWSEGNSRR